MKSRILPYIILGLLCGLLFFWRLGATPLFGQDESLYSECAREMLASGNYIVPTCNGEPFFDKPPLVYWFQCAAMYTFGVNTFSTRLPSAVASLLLVVFAVYLGSGIYGRRTGLAAGFVLASALLTAALAHMGILDSAFGLVIAISLGAFLLAYLKIAPRWMYLIFWAAMGLSLLIKGPAGAVLILGVVIIFLIIRRRLDALRETMPAAGILLLTAIVLPWYVLVQKQTHGAFLWEFIVHQNLQRGLGQDFHHNSPFYATLVFYIIGLFPWCMFLPAAWRGSVKLKPNDLKEEASLFMAIWICVVVFIFSCSRSKLLGYTFPACLPSAILIGLLWVRAMESGKAASIHSGSITMMIVGGLLGVVLPFGQKFLPDPFPGLNTALTIMGISLFLGAVLAFAFVMVNRPRIAFGALCLGMAGFLAAGVGIGLPIVNRRESVPTVHMAHTIGKLTCSSQTVFTYQLPDERSPQLAFYSGRRIKPLKTSLTALRRAISTDSSVYVVTKEDKLRGLPKGGKIVNRMKPFVLYRFDK